MENKPPTAMSPAPIHLISPPPEEDLQPVHKRKRSTIPTNPQTTPNPKPRKQLHLRNPNAQDYRKSATPVPYEPPTQHFESPREIFITPSPTKATRRRRTLRIKTEPPPDLDLSAPIPPPSPTDDPLLLSEPQTRMLLDSSLPPSSPPPPSPLSDDDDDEHVHPLDFTSYRPANLSTSPPIDLSFDGPVPAFTLPPVEKVPLGQDLPADDLSSPQQTTTIEQGEGEYTGRFHQLVIPTKPDPPDEHTKHRMELWGRPVSPYPYEIDRSHTLPPPELPAPSSPLVRDLSLLGLPSRAFSSPTKPNRRRETASFARAKALFGVRSSSPPPVQDDDAPAEEEGVEKDAGAVDPFDFSSLPQAPPQPQPLPSTSLPNSIAHPEPVESEVVPSPEEPEVVDPPEEEQVAHEAGSEDESDPDDDDPSLIKITSSDPRAAARAAAILKQHDYDCYARLLLRRRSKPKHQTINDLRRKTISSSSTSGISKRPRVPRKSVGVLDDLVDEASFTLGNTTTSTPVKATTKTPKRPPATGTSDWNKDHWRFLDGCFTDVRLLDTEEGGGGMKPVDQVDLGQVVDRFIDLIGGEEGEVGWSRDEILGRARAIRKKQARGDVGVPATPTPTQPTQPTQVWRFDTPEFTPLPLSKLKSQRAKDKDWVLPSPAPFKAPASVLQAPRYGHLLDEARRVHSLGSSSRDVTQQEPEEQEGVDDEQEQERDLPAEEVEEEEWEDELEVSRSLSLEPDSDPDSEPSPEHERRTTLGGKLQGLLFSYLPTLSSRPQPQPTSKHPKPSARPVLPPPPPARPRQIHTPARPAPAPTKIPKVKEDLVHIEPPKPRMKERERPRRLMELKPVPAPVDKVVREVREVKRKSSVKDLVKCFEEKEKAGEVKGKGKVPAWRP